VLWTNPEPRLNIDGACAVKDAPFARRLCNLSLAISRHPGIAQAKIGKHANVYTARSYRASIYLHYPKRWFATGLRTRIYNILPVLPYASLAW